MKMKRTILLVGLAACLAWTGCNQTETPVGKGDSAALSAAGEAVEWLTDFPAALAKAKAENKRVFLDFTGSDWCSACKMIKKKVLTSAEFLAYAKTDLVLVELDFPMNHPQTDALKAANKALSEKFKIDGYPTLVVVNADGQELWREEGYDDDTPKQYVAKLKAIKQK